MGANAQTSVPTFTAGEVLTAANMNISARTGVPVFADTTARDAGFGGTGEKTLAEGQLCYLESTNVVQYYDGSTWATVGPTTVSSGLSLVSTTTIGSGVASVTVSSAFSSTYDNYRIIIAAGASSSDGSATIKLGSTTTGYYWSFAYVQFNSSTVTGVNGSNDSSWNYAAGYNTTGISGIIDIDSPNLAKNTIYRTHPVQQKTTGLFGIGGGWLNDTTQYTAFTITPAGGETFTGGTISVYGYAK